MNNECAFSRLHPITLLLWFAAALTVTVMTIDPIFAALSFIGAASHNIMITKGNFQPRPAVLTALMMIAVTLLNPFFSHHGVTILFFFNDLPITLEAILYGAMMSVIIAASMLWCVSLSRCLTSDKVIYLVGRAFPKLAVLLSLTLRLIPEMRRKYKSIYDTRRACGLSGENGIIARVRSTLAVFSALITMTLEDSIDTADSMRARGIALKGRTCFSDFRVHISDVAVISASVITAVIICAASICGRLYFSFYPVVTAVPVNIWSVISYAAFTVLMIIPTLLEVIMWRRLSLKM